MSLSLCAAVSLFCRSDADESVIAAPNPEMVWYVVAELTVIAVPPEPAPGWNNTSDFCVKAGSCRRS